MTSDSDSQFSFPERPLGSPTPSKLSSMSSVDMGAGNEDLVQVASPSHKYVPLFKFVHIYMYVYTLHVMCTCSVHAHG